MSETSHVLGLPYIQPAQAQKHVTHNEAIRVLDTLVQLSVSDRDQTTPPSAPSPGDRHIVPTGASGVWAGQDHSVAVFEDAAWAFYAPQAGWQTVIRSENIVVIWDGAAWATPSFDASALQNIDSLGVNTTADPTNRLSVASDATLLNHDGSDHRVVVNKNTPTDTASLLFQTGFSGRAEMGTAGSDDFDIKVSADAATWNTGMSIDAATGVASFPSGAKVYGRTELGGRFYCYSDNRWITHSGSQGPAAENISNSGGTGVDPTLTWSDLGVLITQGTRLDRINLALRRNSAEITGYDLQVYFQTGPWDSDWSSDAQTTRTLIGSLTAEPVGTGFARAEVDLGGFEAPDDGFILMYLRPTGTISSTRYLYGGVFLSFLSSS